MNNMDNAVLVAIITAGVSLIGTIITVVTANKSTLAAMSEQSKLADKDLKGQIAVIEEKIDTLSARVDKHNNLIDRTYKLETKVAVLETLEGGKAS